MVCSTCGVVDHFSVNGVISYSRQICRCEFGNVPSPAVTFAIGFRSADSSGWRPAAPLLVVALLAGNRATSVRAMSIRVGSGGIVARAAPLGFAVVGVGTAGLLAPKVGVGTAARGATMLFKGGILFGAAAFDIGFAVGAPIAGAFTVAGGLETASPRGLKYRPSLLLFDSSAVVENGRATGVGTTELGVSELVVGEVEVFSGGVATFGAGFATGDAGFGCAVEGSVEGGGTGFVAGVVGWADDVDGGMSRSAGISAAEDGDIGELDAALGCEETFAGVELADEKGSTLGLFDSGIPEENDGAVDGSAAGGVAGSVGREKSTPAEVGRDNSPFTFGSGGIGGLLRTGLRTPLMTGSEFVSGSGTVLPFKAGCEKPSGKAREYCDCSTVDSACNEFCGRLLSPFDNI
jgi:hypothetical protein